MKNTDVATCILSAAQVVGFVAVILGGGPVSAIIIGIAGFAAIVNLFLPYHSPTAWFRNLKVGAAICGLGLIVCAILRVM